MKSINFRQGDVYLKSVILPETSVEKNSKDSRIIARGEWSDHSHVVTGDAKIFESEGKLYIGVGENGAKLQHTFESKLDFMTLSEERDMEVADHEIIELPPNSCFEVNIQNEYNPYSKLFEQVKD